MRTVVPALLSLLLAAACGHAAPAPAPVVPSPRVPAAPAQPAGAAPAPAEDADRGAFRARVEALTAAIRGRDFAHAEELLERLATEVGGRHPRVDLVSYYRAALAAYRGDLPGTVAAFEAQLAAGGAPGDATMSFGYHDALIMVRTAQGDLTGALVECQLMTEAGQGPPFTDDADGRNTVLLKRYWHEAYLWRMAAAAVPAGFFHEGALAAARRAREDFRRLSRSITGDNPSIAVLDAFFAVHDGDPGAALAAARRVDVATDDDLEDLYLVQMGLDFGGDAAGAAAVRARIGKLDEVSVPVPIVALFIARDLEAAKGGPVAWTPLHPRGARP